MDTAVKQQRYFTNHLQAFLDMACIANERKGFPAFKIEHNVIVYNSVTGDVCIGTRVTRDFMYGTTEYKFDEYGMFIP